MTETFTFKFRLTNKTLRLNALNKRLAYKTKLLMLESSCRTFKWETHSLEVKKI